jgi:hypothetical protein
MSEEQNSPPPGTTSTTITTTYTREWVGLTDDERIDIRARVQEYTPLDSVKYGEAIQRATEAKLKEKNT